MVDLQGGGLLAQRVVRLVHEDRHIREHLGLGHRARRARLDDLHADQTVPQTAQHLPQRGQVVDVVEAFTHGLQHHRKAGIVAGHREQLRGPLALLPQGRAFAGGVASQ